MRLGICPVPMVVAILTGLACGQTSSTQKSSSQTSSTWTQLPLTTCRVDEFLKTNPKHNGYPVVIAVLDTGVDPTIPGLTLTPDGKTKVIDVQDFSGEGDTELHRVRLNKIGTALIEYDEEGSPVEYVLPPLPKSTGDEERFFWFATLDEDRFVNGDVPDLNDNGTTDDSFAICVTALTGDGDDQALAFVDTNLDRSFADEKPLQNYRLAFDTFTLARAKKEQQIVPMAFAVNIFLRQHKIVFHFDDGAHGTHVAGIAAGYGINNQDGFNGVAPGARIISLKIGQNAIGGISTTEAMKKSYEYAARFAREHGVPVVCNMSYGVESVIEGNAEIEKFLDELLRMNPNLIVCTSAGNEGPGLSSVGNPASAASVITVGALLAPGPGRDVLGYDITEPVVTTFSSRGGEAPKPDIVTPGWCTSTVPRYVRGRDFWRGTSMASPHAAGLCALLISDATARHPDLPVRAADVRRALRLTGRPLPLATPLDIGWGLADLPDAAKLLDKLIVASKDDPVIDYEVSTPCPHGHEGRAQAAYWRSTYFPTDPPQAFIIKPIFAPGTDESARTSFTRRFELRSNTPWCRVKQEHIYLRSEQSARIFVEYDRDMLTEPGLHTGTVDAIFDGRIAFRLLSTVVVPYRFGTNGAFSRVFTGRSVTGWHPDRYFVAVPPGASAMYMTLSAPQGKNSRAQMSYLFDPTGKQSRRRGMRLDTDAEKREVHWPVTDELTPGVWEIPILADRPDRTWPYELTVRFAGLHAEPARIQSWSDGGGELTVTNLFERPLKGTADGLLEGFRTHKDAQFKGLKDELAYTIDLDDRFSRVRIDLEMTPEDYAQTTDIGVVLKHDGHAIYSSAFSNRTHQATVPNPNPGGESTLKLVITGGFAVQDDTRETPITVDIDYLLADPPAIQVTRGESSNVDFVPAVPIKLDFELDAQLPAAPDNAHPVGFIRFRERGSRNIVLRVPINITDE